MKATLTFNLADPDDKMNHLAAVKSGDMAGVLWEIVHNLKKSCHQQIEHDTKVYDHYEAVELVFEKIHDLLDESNIIIDELTC